MSTEAQPPPERPRLGGIEALRGLAASAVVLYHAARHVDKAYGAPGLAHAFLPGHAGVDLFFVLSGFIILHVHARDIGVPARLPHYANRRFSRVMPLYWVALCVTILAGSLGGHGWPAPWRVAVSASLLPAHLEPLLGVAWTLQYEIVFYAAFALLVLDRKSGRHCWPRGWPVCWQSPRHQGSRRLASPPRSPAPITWNSSWAWPPPSWCACRLCRTRCG